MTIVTLNSQREQREYTLRDMGDGGFLISGHPKLCPVPVPCVLFAEPVIGQRMTVLKPNGEPLLYTTPVVEVKP